MFFNIPIDKKNSYKIGNFPQNITLSGDLNTIGSDNILKIKLSFSDGETYSYKVYKNAKAQDYLKIKIFAITNVIAEEQIVSAGNTNNIKQIENIIANYNLPSVTLNAVYDHKPINITKRRTPSARTNLPSLPSAGLLNRSIEYVGIVNLEYNTSLVVPESDVSFLKIGYYVYNDIEEYAKDNSLDPKYIDESIIWDKLYIKNVISNNTLQPNSGIKDIRKIKLILQNNNFLENLNDFIDIQSILEKQLKKTTSNKKLNSYFSKMYFARTKEKNLGMIFHYDIKSIISKNSSFVNIANANQELFNIFKSAIRVDSVKILRRQVLSKNNDSDNYKILYDTEKNIIQTSLNTNLSLNNTNSDTANIMGIDTNLFGNSIKTVSVEDKTVFISKPGKYQYGISLTVKDGLGFLFRYLSEQQLDGSIKALKNFTSVLENPKYYDPVDATITSELVNYILINKNLMNDVKKALESFIGVLNIFGIDKNLDANYITSINNLFNIKNLDLQQINYFISIFEKIQNQIIKLSKNNHENSFILEHWFSDVYNTDGSIDVGFKFFDSSTINGLSLITSEQLVDKIKNEIFYYASEPSELNDSSDPYLYSYITPDTLLLPNNKSFNIKDLSSENNVEKFSEISLELKKNSIFNSDADNIKYLKDPLNETAENLIKNSIAYSGEIISNNLSIATNFIKKPINNTNNNISNEAAQKENNVDSSTLMLQILSHYNLTSKKFAKINKSNDEGKISVNAVTDILPIHLKLLLQNKSKIIAPEIKYLKDIKQYYKFSIMFNTIHRIEYLSYGSSLNHEKWEVLNNTIFQKFAGNTNIICRLRSYTNESLKVKGIEEFKVPIYDEYFLLNINNIVPDIEFEEPVINIVDDFDEQAAALAAEREAAELAARLAAEQAAAQLAAQQAAAQLAAQQAAKLEAERIANLRAEAERTAAERAAAKKAADEAAAAEAKRIAERRAEEERIATRRAQEEAAARQAAADLQARRALEKAAAELSAQQAAEMAAKKAAELAVEQAAQLAVKQAAKKAADLAAQQAAAQQAVLQQAQQLAAQQVAQRQLAQNATNNAPSPTRTRRR